MRNLFFLCLIIGVVYGASRDEMLAGITGTSSNMDGDEDIRVVYRVPRDKILADTAGTISNMDGDEPKGIIFGTPRDEILADTTGTSSDMYGDEAIFEDNKLKDDCYTTKETKFEEICENFNNTICYTTHKENCADIEEKKCHAIQASKQERECFEVSELHCSLKENQEFRNFTAEVINQKCNETFTEQVCDTIYDTTYTQKDKFKCINIEVPDCTTKAIEVQDKVCRTNVEFNCDEGYVDAHGENLFIRTQHRYLPNVECTKRNVTTCYDNPRFVYTTTCKNKVEQVCEKLTDNLPTPTEFQNCRVENNAICKFDDKSPSNRLLGLEEYSRVHKRYREECVPISKKVCNVVHQMNLEPSCVPSSRKVCNYIPKVNCEIIPERFCHKVPYRVEETNCN